LKVWTGARIVDAGVVQVFTRSDTLVIGVDWNPDIPRAQQQAQIDVFADILTKSNASVTVKEDVQLDRYIKVIWSGFLCLALPSV
jgi:hypothetical protein